MDKVEAVLLPDGMRRSLRATTTTSRDKRGSGRRNGCRPHSVETCASAHGWCCSTSPVRTSSRSTWCCASFRLSILRRRLYIRPHHRIARALSDVVSSLLLEPLLQQAWQRGRRTSCGSPMRLTSEESTIWLVL